MKHLARRLVAIFSVAVLTGAALAAPEVGAINVFDNACNTNPDSQVCKAKGDTAGNLVRVVVDAMLLILGMVAVVMIIVGGIRYVTSNGEPGNIKAAKDTILYSVIGLIVAILSFAIVRFVTAQFGGG